MERGIVRIKPVFVGIPDYREVYGSACSVDVEGAARVAEPDEGGLRRRAREMVSRLRDAVKSGFVEVGETLLIKEDVDMRPVASELTCDTDTLLVET